MASIWFCAALHFVEGDVGAGLRHRGDQAGVLQRQEAFRHDDVEKNGGGQRRQRHQQRLALVAQHPNAGCGDRPRPCGRAGREKRRDSALSPPPLVAQQPAAHHRRQRQRHDGRGHHRDGEREREFAEHAADQAGHEQQRDEHRDQRQRQRYHGEADFAGAAQRRVERLLAVLHVADDVLDHDDGVVDDEAGADGQRHQRQVVEREAGRTTSRRRSRSATAAAPRRR